ncbi:MAG: TonB-dependent receptor [Terriglobia bacterium]|jgi:hypothetical protein
MERRGFFLHILFLALVVPAVFFLTSAPLHAQADTGSIQGTIRDQSGAVFPGAKVILTNEGTNLTITVTAGGDGSYIFSPIKIGIYAVSGEAPGFAKAVQSHITLNLQQQLVVDLTLKPGAVTQTIEVTAAPPALQTQNASVGQVVNARAVNNLPLNGRNFTFLAQLAAGVNTPEADTRGNAMSGAFSANGLRPAQNNYLLDGIDNNSNTVDFLNGTNFVVLPPLDAIQEFKVQTSDYSAQFGRAGGAILNATIKSGTNNFHGTAWEYVRNDLLDAADWFEDAGQVHKGEYRQNQFGATIGGPIFKNKVFFFADYEGVRKRQGTVFTSTVPTMAERNSGYTDLSAIVNGQKGTQTDDLGRVFPVGTIFDPATTRAVTKGALDPVTNMTATTTGYVRDPFSTCPITTTTYTLACGLNQLPPGRLDQNAIKLLNLFPSPTNGNLSSNYADSPVGNQHSNAFDVRMDFNKGDKNQIFARFSYVDNPQYIPGPFVGITDGGAFQQGIQTANSVAPVASWTHTFSPTSVNEARLGYSRIGTSRTGPVPSQFGIPAQYGIQDIPQESLNGGLPAFGIGNYTTLGSNAFLPSQEVSETTQVTDNFTKTYGKHTFKMGIEYQRVRYSTLQPSWSHGQFDFNGQYTDLPYGQTDDTGVAQFLVTPLATSTVTGGVPYEGGADQIYASNIARTDDGKNYWGAYFEDDWKVSSKLTLNLGLRWDYFGQTFERFGAQANFIPGINGAAAQYLIPSKRKTDVLSPSFLALTANDSYTSGGVTNPGVPINIVYSDNPSLGVSQKTNFGPRVGFAYQWTPKLVMRGGYGMFYDGFENRGYSPNIGENYPFQYSFTPGATNNVTPLNAATFKTFTGTACQNYFPFEAGFSCTPLTPTVIGASGLSLEGIQYNYLTPYTQGWNLTFQYELARDTTVTLAYVGNNTHHIEVFPGSNHVNQILPVSGVVSQLYVPYPNFAQGASYAATEGSSYYHSLQTSFEKHYSQGLTFLATYTYGRSRSDAGDLLNGGVGEGFRAPTMAGFGIQGDYRDADYDMRNVFHFSGGYELPFGPGKHFLTNAAGVEKQILGGWSMQWIATIEGGQPITIGCIDSTTGNLGCTAFIVPGVNRHGSMTNPFTSNNGTSAFLNAAAFTQPCQPGTSTPTGCVPVPAGSIALLGGGDTQVSGPGITRIDYSLFKDFQLSERFRLQFRSEFFNILNHPTFMPPGLGGNGVVSIGGSTTYNSAYFGDIGATRFPGTDSRQIQFALRLLF